MKSNKLKNISISFKSIVSAKLKKKQINEICLLKDKEWKFGIKSQINWFDRNIKRDDVHNLLYIDNKLIGYTLLRKRFCKFNNITKKKHIFCLIL